MRFFSNKMKKDREKWVVREFLDYLKIEVKKNEVASFDDEPPDVVFRDARFEIKEILEENRRRTDEYKKALRIAETATNITDLFEEWSPTELKMRDALKIVATKASAEQKRYAPAVCQSLDLLFYLNPRDASIVGNNIASNILHGIEQLKWRSISFVTNDCAVVMAANDKAPSFIMAKTGKVLRGKKRRLEQYARTDTVNEIS